MDEYTYIHAYEYVYLYTYLCVCVYVRWGITKFIAQSDYRAQPQHTVLAGCIITSVVLY